MIKRLSIAVVAVIFLFAGASEALADRGRPAEPGNTKHFVWPKIEPIRMDGPLAPPPVVGKTYYVATDGNDQTGDGSMAKPWRKIQHGMDQLHPGDCLMVRRGTYKEHSLKFKRSGEPGKFITVRAYPGEQVIIDVQKQWGSAFNMWDKSEQHYVVVRGFSFRNMGPLHGDIFPAIKIWRPGNHHIWITECDIKGGGRLVQVELGATDIVVSNNYMRDDGMFIGNPTTRRIILEWNTIHDAGRDHDDGGAVKIMSPNCMLRYNRVFDCYRSSHSKMPGWAPRDKGGGQWDHLQGVSGLYLDWAQAGRSGKPSDDESYSYVYGNEVFNNNAGIYIWQSPRVHVFDNVCYNNGYTTTGGWVKGEEGGKWLGYGGPFGKGIEGGYSTTTVHIYNNLCFNNRNDGISIRRVNDVEIYDNIVYGNGRSQISIAEGERVVMGYNTIFQAPGDPRPIKHFGRSFENFRDMRRAVPYADVGSTVVEVAPEALSYRTAGATGVKVVFDQTQWDAEKKKLLTMVPSRTQRVAAKTVQQMPHGYGIGEQDPMPWPIPGKLEAEKYDLGGPGVSYQDKDEPNHGGAYREEDEVDIKRNDAASNQHVIGWGLTGEWLEYTVAPKAAGNYKLVVRYASTTDAARFHFEVDGKDVSGPITAKPTADWDTLADLTAGVRLNEGKQVLRLVIDHGPIDFDVFTFEGPYDQDFRQATPAPGSSEDAAGDGEAGVAPSNIIIFETDFSSRMQGWKPLPNHSWMLGRFRKVSEPGRTFVRLSDNPTAAVIDRPLPAGVKKVKLSFDYRLIDLKPGPKAWHVPAVDVNFFNAEGKKLNNHRNANWLKEDTEWKAFTRTYDVPDGATTVQLGISYKAHGGLADFANVRLIAEGVTAKPRAATSTTPPPASEDGGNGTVIYQTDFSERLQGWTPEGGHDWMLGRFRKISEPDRTFVRVHENPANAWVDHPLPADAKQVKLTFDYRLIDLKPGSKAWEAPAVNVDFFNAEGKKLNNHRNANWLKEDTEWKTFTRVYDVPEGTAKVRLGMSYKAQSGLADFASLELKIHNNP